MIEHAALHFPPILFGAIAATLIVFAMVVSIGFLAGLGWFLWATFAPRQRLGRRRDWRVI